MKAIQLHDHNEEIIGTILITEKNTEEEICKAWDEYLDNKDFPISYTDIWDFVNT